MAFYVYEDTNLTKQLKALLKGGANAAQAAEHARTIISQSIDGGICNPKLIGRLTRYGEARIKNCIKFDLVAGYRLISMMIEQGIVFLFIGSHDECDRWIKNNTGAEPVLDKKRTRVFEVKETAGTDEPVGQECEDTEQEADYDELVMRDITEQDLRKIFGGLCKNKL
jgi:hypothetical protein